MHAIRVCLLFLLLAGAASADAFATPLNAWKISCGVDKGALVRSGDRYTFRPSKDYCAAGGKMRSELASGRVPTTLRGAYLFHTTFAITAPRNQNFILFQVHDKRPGCAPPLMLRIAQGGRVQLISGKRDTPGRRCSNEMLYGRSGGRGIRLDGTAQTLDILFVFDGRGGFEATVRIDGEVLARVPYVPTSAPGQKAAVQFYFKHGVYSSKRFDFAMTSKGLHVRSMDGRL